MKTVKGKGHEMPKPFPSLSYSLLPSPALSFSLVSSPVDTTGRGPAWGQDSIRARGSRPSRATELT